MFTHISFFLVQVYANKRAKIFALLSHIGLEVVEGLLQTLDDRMTLVTVRNYLRLKQGEVWTAIDLELQCEGVQPVEVSARMQVQGGRSNIYIYIFRSCIHSVMA